MQGTMHHPALKALLEVLATAKPEELCDFCSCPKVYATHAAHDFILDTVAGFDFGSNGAWNACEECDSAIRAQNWTALLDRSVNRWLQDKGGTLADWPGIREHFARHHALFRTHRIEEC